jgi:PHD/YefM family antitoxin component YafN of YafNO toxin-antitoxin module
MIAINYSRARSELKRYCDLAADNGETILITRKQDKNIVMMSLNKYNEMIKRIGPNTQSSKEALLNMAGALDEEAIGEIESALREFDNIDENEW